jgi:hypothetical protein
MAFWVMQAFYKIFIHMRLAIHASEPAFAKKSSAYTAEVLYLESISSLLANF